MPYTINSAHLFGSSLFSFPVEVAFMRLFDLIGVSRLVGYTIRTGIFSYVLRLSKKPLRANFEAQ